MLISTHDRMTCAALAAAAVALATTSSAHAQFSFSIDSQSPTAGAVGEGSILTPIGLGQFPNPAVIIPSGAGGLGIIPTAASNVSEVDALSYGTDVPLMPNNTANGAVYINRWFFSVDEYAIGRPGVPAGPSVTSQGALGLQEAAADVYASNTFNGVVPILPGFNVGVRDGNGGLTPFPAPGNNLREPNPPTPGAPDINDNLDALSMNSPIGKPVYFSLDSFIADPLEYPGINTGTALANGFSGGDVLVAPVGGGAPQLYAPAPLLGLNATIPGAVDMDDLDALILWENGNGAYDPVTGPYSWVGGQTDMLLYSVRRESSVVNQIDALQGLHISEGDILVPVLTAAGTFQPGIFVTAESLGLATIRSMGQLPFGYNDELDGLDVMQTLVPEPGSAMLLLGAGIMMMYRRRIRD